MTISSPSVTFCRYRCRDFSNGRVHLGTMATRASAGALSSPGIVSSPFILADNKKPELFRLALSSQTWLSSEEENAGRSRGSKDADLYTQEKIGWRLQPNLTQMLLVHLQRLPSVGVPVRGWLLPFHMHCFKLI